MAPSPQYPPSGPTAAPPAVSTPSTSHINIAILALSLAFSAFLLVCLSICACSYRRSKLSRPGVHVNRPKFRGEHIRIIRDRQRESDRDWIVYDFNADGRRMPSVNKHEQLPAYSTSSRIITLGWDQGPDQTPRESVPLIYLASPALNGTPGLTPPPTPPPPAYRASI